jgi:hypothetical protein
MSMHSVFSIAVYMNTLQYKLITEIHENNDRLTWRDMYAIFDGFLLRGSVIHRIEESLQCEPEDDLSMVMLQFEWCTDQKITPATKGFLAMWELCSWNVVLAMNGAHNFELRIYEASPSRKPHGNKHYELAMHIEIELSNDGDNDGSDKRAGSICFNREGKVTELYMYTHDDNAHVKDDQVFFNKDYFTPNSGHPKMEEEGRLDFHQWKTGHGSIWQVMTHDGNDIDQARLRNTKNKILSRYIR